jgi:hypothetical protein
MNKSRRNAVSAIVSQLEEIAARLADLRDAEREAFDSLPDGLQSSERGEAMGNAADALETATDAVESAATELGDIVNA